MTTSTSPPSSDNRPDDDDPPAPRKSWIELSGTQLAGGAMAAGTAAYLGSRLGLAGTLVGAVVASLLTATASAVYTASLRHGREKVRAAVGRVRPAPLSAADGNVRGVAGRDSAGDPYRQEPGRRELSRREPGRRLARINRIGLRTVLVGAAAVFLTALAAITGVELLTGHALSGGSGTTVQQVSGEQQGTRKAAPKSADPKTATSTSAVVPTATATATATTTVTPSTTVTVTATPTPTATSTTTEPTPTPTASSPTSSGSPGASPTATPTATR